MPRLPPIEGVRLSTAAAGILYDRADVLMASLSKGQVLRAFLLSLRLRLQRSCGVAIFCVTALRGVYW